MDSIKDKKWIIAVSVSAGALMAAIDTFILYVATPHLRGVFSATNSEISWISSSYAVSAMIFMLLSSWLCRQYGKKYTYQTGLVAFIGGSALCGFASSLEMIIIFRVIQGVGAGILLPVENVILRETFPPSQHGLVIGIYGTTIMIGPAFGPMIGGIIIDNFHWTLLFWVNIPIGLASLYMVHKFVPEGDINANQEEKKIDILGLVLLSIGLFCLVWLLERGNRLYWFDTTSNVVLLMVSIFSLAFFCAHELSIKNPVINLRVLKQSRFAAATSLSFLMGFAISATLFVLPIYMQDLLDFTATKAGTALAPRAIVMMIAFPLIGLAFNKLNLRASIIFGILLCLSSAILMTRFTHDTGWQDMVLPQILQGVGVAFILTPLATITLINISPDKLPAAAGFDAVSRQVGSSFGVAIFASLLTHYEQSSWGQLRHHISFSSTVLYKRFEGVIEFFSREVASNSFALEKSMRLLNARVDQQVLVLTYGRLFELIGVVFVFMIFISLYLLSKNNYQVIK